MANLKEIVLLTGEQYKTLSDGGTIGTETGIDLNSKLYLMEKSGFELAEQLCNETSIPSGTSTITSVYLNQPVTAFDLIVILVQAGSTGQYVPATIASNMYSLFTSSYKLVLKGQSTYYATVYFSGVSDIEVSSNRATSIIVYGVDL